DMVAHSIKHHFLELSAAHNRIGVISLHQLRLTPAVMLLCNVCDFIAYLLDHLGRGGFGRFKVFSQTLSIARLDTFVFAVLLLAVSCPGHSRRSAVLAIPAATTVQSGARSRLRGCFESTKSVVLEPNFADDDGLPVGDFFHKPKDGVIGQRACG